MKKLLKVMAILSIVTLLFSCVPIQNGDKTVKSLTERINDVSEDVDFKGEIIAEDADVNKAKIISNLDLNGKTLTVNVSGVTLVNIKNANVVAGEGIAEGDLTIEGCGINKLTVLGGGKNSIHLKETKTASISVEKDGVRLDLQAGSSVETVEVSKGDVKIEAAADVVVNAVYVDKTVASMEIAGGTIKALEIKDADSTTEKPKIVITDAVTIEKITDVEVKITEEVKEKGDINLPEEVEPIVITVTGCELNVENAKIEYTKGDEIDLSNIYLVKTYSDGSKLQTALEASEITVENFDSSKIGTCKVKITYKETSKEFNVVIIEEAAKKITVTLDTDGGTMETTIYSFWPEEDIEIEEIPLKAGLFFNGWYDAEGNKVTKAPAEDITLKAKWGDKLQLGEWNLFSTLELYPESTVVINMVKPETDTEEWAGIGLAYGGDIKGWWTRYAVNELLKYKVSYLIDLKKRTMPDSDIFIVNTWGTAFEKNTTMYLTYEDYDFTIDFDTNGGNELEPLFGFKNTSNIIDFPTPIKDGYVFWGWFMDEDLTIRVHEDILNSSADKNITLYAGWEEIGAFDTTTQHMEIRLPYADDWAKVTLDLKELPVGTLRFRVYGSKVDENSWDGQTVYCSYSDLPEDLKPILDLSQELENLKSMDNKNIVTGVSIQNTTEDGTVATIKINKITVTKTDGSTEDINLSGLDFGW